MERFVQLPAVGRMVHYRAYGTPGGEYAAGVVRAAIVTEVCEPENPRSPLGLAILNPSGLFFNRFVSFGGGPGEWSWPVYVAPVPAGVVVDVGH